MALSRQVSDSELNEAIGKVEDAALMPKDGIEVTEAEAVEVVAALVYAEDVEVDSAAPLLDDSVLVT